MSLEAELKANTEALNAHREVLEKLVAAGGTTANAAPTKTERKKSAADAEAKAADAEVEKSPKISVEEFQAKVREYAKATNKAAAKSIMAEFGAEAMADVKASDRDACYQAVCKALEEAQDDDDI